MAFGIDPALGAGKRLAVALHGPEMVAVEMELVVDHARVDEAHELAGPASAGRGGKAEVADVDLPRGAGHQRVLLPDPVQRLVRGSRQGLEAASVIEGEVAWVNNPQPLALKFGSVRPRPPGRVRVDHQQRAMQPEDPLHRFRLRLCRISTRIAVQVGAFCRCPEGQGLALARPDGAGADVAPCRAGVTAARGPA